jgi:hypothetical protein
MKKNKSRALYPITLRSDEHYQNAEIANIRVDVELLPKYSKLIKKGLIDMPGGINKHIFLPSPPFAHAYCVNRLPAKLRRNERDKDFIEYFVINEVLGTRMGWAPLQNPLSIVDEDNLDEKTRRVLNTSWKMRGQISFRRQGPGVNIYVATPEQIDKILGVF